MTARDVLSLVGVVLLWVGAYLLGVEHGRSEIARRWHARAMRVREGRHGH